MSGSGKPDSGTDCYLVRDREECTGKQCVWCHNKWSPMPGSDGFCEWKAKVGELPSIVYDCKRVKPQGQQQEQQAQHEKDSHVSNSRAGPAEGRGPVPVRAATASSSALHQGAAAGAAAAGSRQPGGPRLASLPAAAGVRAAPDGSECYKIKERSDCTPAECVWCRNKWSPWESAQGVCVWEKKASELPDWAYSCHHVKPSQAVAAAVV